MFRKKQKIEYPKHIAFIMDGNRRWATSRGLNKVLGHRQGCIALKNIIEVLCKIEDIKYASFFAFSTENWKREKSEIDYIFQLVREMLKENEQTYIDTNVKVVAMGDLTRFPKDLQENLERVMEKTKNNTGLVVNLALNYGGRSDIIQAANKVFEKHAVLTEENLRENLYAGDIPDIDFLVRTSGEQRISNFMLFHLAYSEFYFTKVYWPDFGEKQLLKALKSYAKRERRFGGK